MALDKNIFLNKKILIYGLGRTGLSVYKFLKIKVMFFYLMIFYQKIIH